MKKRILALFVALLSLTITTTSCSSDDNTTEIVQRESKLTVNLKSDKIKEFLKVDLTITETNTGKVTQEKLEGGQSSISLLTGSYKIVLDGRAISTDGEEIGVGGTTVVDLVKETQSVEIEVVAKAFNDDFIIEEIFFVGVRTLEDKSFNNSKYFKIVNNTDKVLNTGGLLILQSEFLSNVNNNVTPDKRSSAMAVKGVIMIPSDLGKDVAPGDFIIVADNAVDHRTPNVPAFNLSKADYEYPNLENPKLGQVDNPLIPNVPVIYSTMNFNMFFMNNRGTESFALARFPKGEDPETWMTNYKYDYEYPNKAGKITKKSVYEVPNSWIIDGVNLAIKEEINLVILDPSIDNGWTGIGDVNHDKTRFGKTVRRKVIGTNSEGRNIYKDTNNSVEDFVQASEPSVANGIVH
ncbi:DUF4876 domain-containing protein [Myroides injenensis]|uniref:DUF4876 domain-containing protein n=1 Tax=Myroides injenensis TaxID=1183151 RepID=UPI0022716894|nr:DUF4876 domain-containing protein [Myroides injenensis]